MTASGSLQMASQHRPALVCPGQGEERNSLEQRIEALTAEARAAAEAGDVAGSARLILACLDCERRLASRGPQVLQLIKPRC